MRLQIAKDKNGDLGLYSGEIVKEEEQYCPNVLDSPYKDFMLFGKDSGMFPELTFEGGPVDVMIVPTFLIQDICQSLYRKRCQEIMDERMKAAAEAGYLIRKGHKVIITPDAAEYMRERHRQLYENIKAQAEIDTSKIQDGMLMFKD